MYQVVTRNPMVAINKANALEKRGFIVTMEVNGPFIIVCAVRTQVVRHVA